MNAVEPTADLWNARDYGQNAHFVADLALPLLDWLEPLSGKSVLDLGCGDGALTAQIAARGANVTGLDASPAFVKATRKRGLTAVQGDGQSLNYEQTFDYVFSNAALHWMQRDPHAVIASVYAALKAGGRFVAELGAEGNIEAIRVALREQAARQGLDAGALDPWYFPEPTSYLDDLRTAGFVIERESAFTRPTPLPGNMRAWLTTLAQPFVQAVPAAQREGFLSAVSEQLKPQLCDAQGQWTAPYVRLRFDARRPR